MTRISYSLASTFFEIFVEGAHDMIEDEVRIEGKEDLAYELRVALIGDITKSASVSPSKHPWLDTKLKAEACFRDSPDRASTFQKVTTAAETCTEDPVDPKL